MFGRNWAAPRDLPHLNLKCGNLLLVVVRSDVDALTLEGGIPPKLSKRFLESIFLKFAYFVANSKVRSSWVALGL